MTKGNNNQQRDADFHFLCIIPTGKSQSAVNYHFALYPVTVAVPALHCTDKKPSESNSTFQLKSKTMSSGDQVTEFRQQGVHCYSVFTRILLRRVLFLFVAAEAAAPAASTNQPQPSWEAEAKSPLPQRTDAKDATYRWDLPNRFHYIPHAICPSMLCQLCDR